MPDTTDPVRHEIRIDAPPDLVFHYFTDPARMVEWFGIAAVLDPRPGGIFRVEANGRDVVVGQYIALEPPHRVCLSWGFAGTERDVREGASWVEVTLEPEGDGTLLTLDHHGLVGDTREAHRQGWDHYLARLTAAAAGEPPGRDPWIIE